MEADYGGTEMKAALEAAFSKRAKDRPTNLFVLTDGDVSPVTSYSLRALLIHSFTGLGP